MDNLNLIFLSIGFVSLLIALLILIFNFVRKNYKTSVGTILLALTGFSFLLVGIGVPNLKEEIISVESKGEEVLTLTEEATSEGEDYSEISNETEMQKIARELVGKEMSKQVGLKEWSIIENKVTSDNYVFNIADYEKPVGDMRKVWIEGYVKATSADDGSTGNVGYNLELYQMKDDSKWYIGKHWGVLSHLEVTEEPVVFEDKRFLSDSAELIIDEETGRLSTYNVPEYGESFEEANPTTEKDLIGAWHWSGLDDYYMILRKDYTFSYFEAYEEYFSEGTYTVNQSGDYYEVDVNYTTGQNDSLMTIKLINKNHLEGNMDGDYWDAERVNSSFGEDVLNHIKAK
ncbi:hypothetical protein RJD24_01705 [Bacillaceae bacterium IKA-2]|nr:hypothetical protein RJD24_01705 [Bacillaceae bacterium IKA-2]